MQSTHAAGVQIVSRVGPVCSALTTSRDIRWEQSAASINRPVSAPLKGLYLGEGAS